MTLDTNDSGNWLAEHEVAGTPNEAGSRAQKRLVVAIDRPNVAEATQLVSQLGDLVEVYKVGLELVLGGGGLAFAKRLQQECGKKIFLDMKLLDIPNTVEKAVANVAKEQFDFLTIHGLDRKTLAAAVQGRSADKRPESQRLKLLSVTVLTSGTTQDLHEQGISGYSPLDLAVRRARMACDEGFDGVIASGHEAEQIRAATRPGFIIKVPGIRPAETSVGDQSRIMTPTQALRAGATYLVVGRPITDSPQPADAARAILNEMTRYYASARH